MAKYIGKRLLYMAFTLLVIIVLTFTLMKILPGSPFDAERFEKLTPEQQATTLARYGLDKPIYEQFFIYLGNILKGDLGTSFYYTNMSVTTVIASRLGPSMLIGAQAIIIGLTIGLILGIVAACRHNGVIDNISMVIAVLGISVPNFVAAALLQYYVGLKLGWLPVGFWKSWSCSVLPSIALCFQPMATAARFIRAETLDVLQQDYIVTARSKGMSQARLLIKHTLRNSIIPVITIMGSMVVSLLTGSLAVESIFSIPGIGGLFTESVKNNDYNVIMGLTMFYSAFYMIAILVVDVAYSMIDPRIRISAGKGGE